MIEILATLFLGAVALPWQLESQIRFNHRQLERWVNPDNEDHFKVLEKRKPEDLSLVLELENPDLPLLKQAVPNNERAKRQRRFYNQDRLCQAHTRQAFPDPFASPRDRIVDSLPCHDFTPHPQSGASIEWPTTKIAPLRWMNDTQLPCDPQHALCHWNFNLNSLESLILQIVMSFQEIRQFLSRAQIHFEQIPITTIAFRDQGNRSYYDADHRQLVFGAGSLPDAMDASIILHEWFHSVIDDLNPQLWGEQAYLLHEALSDFFSASLLKTPCFGHFDAHDLSDDSSLSSLPTHFELPTQIDNLCLRDLSSHRPWEVGLSSPRRMREGALVVASALWEIQSHHRRSASLHNPWLWHNSTLVSIALEALIRSPKRLLVTSFWTKMIQIAEERQLNHLQAALQKTGEKRKILDAALSEEKEL